MNQKPTEKHGTVELRAERLILRKHIPEDAQVLHRDLGIDPSTYEYSGWNPYATPEMAEEMVGRFMADDASSHLYAWALTFEGILIGTIGAYNYENGRIEIGYSIVKAWRGRGFATEAARKVVEYLTQNEGISCVTAWVAAENTGSRKVLEKAGMTLVSYEKNGLNVDGRIYDKLTFEYRK